MAEPSYHPLTPLKYPLQGTTSPVPDPLRGDSDLPDLSDAVVAKDPFVSRSSGSHNPRLFQKGPSVMRPPLWRTIRAPLQMALFPLAAIGYLAFCYTVHGKAVPVDTYGLYEVTPQHFTTIKGGVTSVSIIIISIALYPIYNIVSDLKGEEFFRALASHSHGVPLQTINRISTPSFGNIDSMVALWNHSCSNYRILGVITSLLVWIVATLAPGALTINSVLVDGELMAFAVGAVSAQSVLNGSYSVQPGYNASFNSVTAASVTWAEMELGAQYSFGVANSPESDYAAFIAPMPLDLSTATSARWLSDVIGINPTCSWPSTNITTPVQIATNSTSAFGVYFATAYLADFDLDVTLTGSDIPFSGTYFATVKDPTSSVTNHSTQAPASGGSTVFLLGQCLSGCLLSSSVNITLDLTGLNTTITIALTDQTWSMAILACIPDITIETREVRNDGQGVLSVQPLPPGGKLTRQGNLNPVQTTALFSIATMSLTQDAGALSGTRLEYSSLGSQVQGDVLYGKAPFEALPGTDAPYGTSASISPAPIVNITQGYTRVIRSAAKSYLAGYLGVAYVPGRISSSGIFFATSIPNLVVATVVFGLLAALIVIVHFRPGKGVEFTLVNVAAAVHESELPALFARTKDGQMATGVYARADVDAEVEGDPGVWGEDEDEGRHVAGDALDEHPDVADMEQRRVLMQRRADGAPVLHIV